jgi:uncharacterized protein (DUF427 family)
MKLPGPDHPITIEPTNSRVIVRVGDTVIADTQSALSLRESTYPVVQYIPLADVDATHIRRTDTSTYCPYKGDASYYSIVGAGSGEVLADAIWTYESPYPAVAPIAGHVAFYPTTARIDVQS